MTSKKLKCLGTSSCTSDGVNSTKIIVLFTRSEDVKEKIELINLANQVKVVAVNFLSDSLTIQRMVSVMLEDVVEIKRIIQT